MATIEIRTTDEEQQCVLEALRNLEGSDKPVSVSAIAKDCGLKQTRVRYVITDLVDAGKINRIPVKAFNKNYIRYRYEVILQP